MEKFEVDKNLSPEDSFVKAVAHCKDLVARGKEIRYEIARIALEVCDIHIGGRPESQHLSIKEFSIGIGVMYKTLHRWMREYKNVISKLPKKITDGGVRRTIIENILKNTTKDSSKKDVKKAYDKVSKNDIYTDNVLKSLKSVKFSICHSLNFNKVDKDAMHAISVMVKEMYNSIETYEKTGTVQSIKNKKKVKTKLNKTVSDFSAQMMPQG